jgi:heme-degrading monooxygenase HmoA
MSLYTAGLWRTKPGHEEEFVAAWHAMAARTAEQFPGAHAELLRDQTDRALFLSVGPWAGAEEIDRWRASDTFREGIAAIRPHLESFEPHTMELATSAGGAAFPGA